jgi:putative spermidine/putrescine transport system substrate-binding protein
MSPRTVLIVVAAVMVTLAAGSRAILAQGKAGPGSVPADQKELVFYGFGGSHEKNMRERVIPPFEKKYGVKVTYVSGTSNSNFARVRAQKSRAEGDVLWTNDVLHVVGKRLGLFEKLDPQRVATLKDVLPFATDAEGIGVMQGFQAEGLAYNTRVFKDRGWAAPVS